MPWFSSVQSKKFIEMQSPLRNAPASSWSLSPVRRIIDISVALLALLIFAIPMGILAACVRFTSNGEALFSQERVGRNGSLFRIYKFRSMIDARGNDAGPWLTESGDRRVTSLGRRMRRLKLDELPQFYNVLRGDMSLVGPRPKLAQFTSNLKMPYRPGITGLATIAFRREEEILRPIHPQQLNRFYEDHIQPEKAALDVCYMSRATVLSDFVILASTILCCVLPARTLTFVNLVSMPLSTGLHSLSEEMHKAITS